MNEIIAIISVFDEENRLEFIKYLQQLNRRSDTKNIELFKLLCKGESEDLDIKLYGKPNKNAFYVLCNRLQNRLVDFMAQASFARETSEEMNCLKLLLASRIFFEQKQPKLGFKTLQRALNAAQEIEAYSIMNEVYQTYIQYAHLQQKHPLASILQQAEQNNERYTQELKVTTLYAQFRVLSTEQVKESFDTQIDQLLKSSDLNLDTELSFKALHQLMSLAVESAQKDQNYYKILAFTQKLIKIVTSKSDIKGRYVFYRMQVMYSMALVLFRNKLLAAASSLLAELKTVLAEHPRYRSVLESRVLLLEGLILFYDGQPEEASNLLLKTDAKDLRNALTLCMFYFQQREFDKAYALMKNWNHSDQWYEKKMGWQWVIQKNIIEILLLIERDKLDLVLTRLESFKRRFNAFLMQKKQERVIVFMQLVDRIYNRPEIAQDPEFIAEVEARLTQKNPIEEDIFVMSFYAWLKSKMTQRPLYETTLDLVKIHGK